MRSPGCFRRRRRRRRALLTRISRAARMAYRVVVVAILFLAAAFSRRKEYSRRPSPRPGKRSAASSAGIKGGRRGGSRGGAEGGAAIAVWRHAATAIHGLHRTSPSITAAEKMPQNWAKFVTWVDGNINSDELAVDGVAKKVVADSDDGRCTA